jgi:hypothetical protein
MITNNADHHSPDYHAEITAEKIIVVAETASAQVVQASRALRKDVERILTQHHQSTHDGEQAALAQHGADRYDHPLLADSAETGHTVVDDTIMNHIVAAAHRHGLGGHFDRPDVQAAILCEIHHETRSQMNVHRNGHRAAAARSASVS